MITICAKAEKKFINTPKLYMFIQIYHITKMVKKRSRTSRKDSDTDEYESESDFGDDPPYDPTPKKYSLRQRKRNKFTDADFQYDDEDIELPLDLPPYSSPKLSEDEDFVVEKELALDEPPESEAPEDAIELVDFEDMIRADIVVNKNGIDYDNVIQKTEIKVQPLSETEKQVISTKKQKTKRGRKPKLCNSDMDKGHFLAPLIQEEGDEDYHPYKPKRERRPKMRADDEIDSSLLEPETEVQEEEYNDKDDADYNPNDDLEYPVVKSLTKCQKETKIASIRLAPNIDEKSSDIVAKESLLVDSVSTELKTEHFAPVPSHNEGDSSENKMVDTKIIPNQDTSTDEFESDSKNVIHVNGTVAQLHNPDVNFAHSNMEEEADDDVVLIDELKHEVIVLDD